MQLRYVLTELTHGLRRNVSMHVAVVLTLFVTLALVGAGVLLKLQADKAEEYWGSQLQITVFLCKTNDDNPRCRGEVTPAQRTQVQQVVDASPQVADWRMESKQVAFEKVKELLGPERFEGPNPPATAEAMPESLWLTLEDPREFDQVLRSVTGLAGVSSTRDLRDVLEPINNSLSALRIGAWGIAGFLVVAALLLVANTIRLAALARRREIEIMRLVGASATYITLPFLLEAVVTAVLGVGLAAGALAAFWWFAIQGRAEDNLKFMPWVDADALVVSLTVIGALGLVLTLLPTLVLTHKYRRV